MRQSTRILLMFWPILIIEVLGACLSIIGLKSIGSMLMDKGLQLEDRS